MTGQIQLLLGDNPLNGVDHLSQDRSRTRNILGNGEITRIISAAMESGATGFTFSTTRKMLEVLHQLRDEDFSKRMGLYPVIPDVQAYFNLIAEKGMVGALTDKLGEMNKVSRLQSIFGGGFGLLTRNPERILRAYIQSEMSLLEDASPNGNTIESVLLHEIGTDLMVSLGMTNLFKAYCDAVEDYQHAVPGFVTRNFPRLINFIRSGEFDLRQYFILTPFNSVGFQMNPTKDACERALANAGNANVIAMSVLAGGYISLEDAVDYISHLPTRVSCAVGVSSETHAQRTFRHFRERLLRRS